MYEPKNATSFRSRRPFQAPLDLATAAIVRGSLQQCYLMEYVAMLRILLLNLRDTIRLLEHVLSFSDRSGVCQVL